MILLDTDHFSALKYEGDPRGRLLRARMASSPDKDFAVTAVTLEEQMRGWLAEIAATLDVMRQEGAYMRLVELVRFFAAWKIVPFDRASAGRCVALRKARLRIGTMDLKIASVALGHGSLLLTANARDFAQVPGLRMDNWLE